MALKRTLSLTLRRRRPILKASTSRRMRRSCHEAKPAGEGVAAYGTDLGGSSKYSSENLEGRSGERFLENSSWSRVNRS